MPSPLPTPSVIAETVASHQRTIPPHHPKSPLRANLVGDATPHSTAPSTSTDRSTGPVIFETSDNNSSAVNGDSFTLEPGFLQRLWQALKRSPDVPKKPVNELKKAECAIFEMQHHSRLLILPCGRPSSEMAFGQSPSSFAHDTPLPLYTKKERHDEWIIPEFCFVYGFAFFPLWIMGTLYLRLKLDEEYNPKLLDYPVTQRREIKEVYRKREKKAARHCLIALATLSFFLGTILVVYFVLHARQARIAGGGPVL